MVHWQPMGCAQDYENSTKSATTHVSFFTMLACKYYLIVVGEFDGFNNFKYQASTAGAKPVVLQTKVNDLGLMWTNQVIN